MHPVAESSAQESPADVLTLETRGPTPVDVELLPSPTPSGPRELARRLGASVAEGLRSPPALVTAAAVTAVAAMATQAGLRIWLDSPAPALPKRSPLRRLSGGDNALVISETWVMTRTVVRRRP